MERATVTDNQDNQASLKPVYAARLAEDLERNVQAQERLARDLAALQKQLETLRGDHALLVSMQQALGGADSGTEPAATHSAEPAVPSQKSAATQSPERGQETGATTLRELVVSHLSLETKPISALDVTEALTKAHPDRNVKITVVRSTLEAMVAKGTVRRTKEGRAVFYSVQTSRPARRKQPASA